MEKTRYKKSQAILLLEELAYENYIRKHPSIPEKYIGKPKYRDDKTNSLTRAIIDFIIFNGGQAERINSTGRFIDNRKTFVDVAGRKRTIGTGKWIRGNTQTGTADISAVIKGRPVKIEVKCRATGDRYQSEKQKEYQQMIENAGGLYFIARDFESFYIWYILNFNCYE